MTAPPSIRPDNERLPPFETADLREKLAAFLKSPFPDPSGVEISVGNYQWGVYAFYDFDGEPIYVGQTNEKLRTRIRRHLTNQRTDAVAMSVLDPFEVMDIEVWPLPHLLGVSKENAEAKAYLNALESVVTQMAIERSAFRAILNEKNPPPATVEVSIPQSFRGTIISDRVRAIRSHPDFRLARRALIISRLSQVIAERQVQVGLRRVLLTQAIRMKALAERRYLALGGDASVEVEAETEE